MAFLFDKKIQITQTFLQDSLKALITNQANVVALDSIYESEVEKPDPIKKAKLKFRVVTI